jgi:hypothetical protein
MIQEFRFNQYCERLQGYICRKLDDEFKLFLRWRGLNIDSGLFALEFNPPQNFASYRQAEMDTARVSTFSAIEQYPYISKRFALERFLGLTEEEINRNEKMWREENDKEMDVEPKGNDLRSIGISSGDIQSDIDTGEEAEAAEQSEGESPEIIAPVNTPTPGSPDTAGAVGAPPGAI